MEHSWLLCAMAEACQEPQELDGTSESCAPNEPLTREAESPDSSTVSLSGTWSSTPEFATLHSHPLRAAPVSPLSLTGSFRSSLSTTATPESSRTRRQEPTPPRAKRSRKSFASSASNVMVQQFSLRSRLADSGHSRAPTSKSDGPAPTSCRNILVQPGETSLRFNSLVQLCPCSWHPNLSHGQPRPLCQRNTEEHDEHALLDTLCRRLAAECGVSVAPTLARDACLRKRDVHFIISPLCPTENVKTESPVVGYIATRSDLVSLQSEAVVDAPLLVISQLFVEREFRGRGLAKGTLTMLLNRKSVLGLDAVTPDLEGLLRSIGFRRNTCRQLFGQSDGDESPVIFRRRRMSDRDAENIRSMSETARTPCTS